MRWTGTITPRYSETYTFATRSDDGIRVTIGGQTVIDNWTVHAVTTDTGEIDLEADTPYPITVEFYEHLGRAEVSLGWSSASQAAEIVPEERLSPARPGPDGHGHDAHRHWHHPGDDRPGRHDHHAGPRRHRDRRGVRPGDPRGRLPRRRRPPSPARPSTPSRSAVRCSSAPRTASAASAGPARCPSASGSTPAAAP